MTDRECLLQIVAHLGLDGPVETEPTQEQYQVNEYKDGRSEIVLGWGGGDEESHVHFIFRPDGTCSEHYVFDKT